MTDVPSDGWVDCAECYARHEIGGDHIPPWVARSERLMSPDPDVRREAREVQRTEQIASIRSMVSFLVVVAVASVLSGIAWAIVVANDQGY